MGCVSVPGSLRGDAARRLHAPSGRSLGARRRPFRRGRTAGASEPFDCRFFGAGEAHIIHMKTLILMILVVSTAGCAALSMAPGAQVNSGSTVAAGGGAGTGV